MPPWGSNPCCESDPACTSPRNVHEPYDRYTQRPAAPGSSPEKPSAGHWQRRRNINDPDTTSGIAVIGRSSNLIQYKRGKQRIVPTVAADQERRKAFGRHQGRQHSHGQNEIIDAKISMKNTGGQCLMEEVLEIVHGEKGADNNEPSNNLKKQ